MMQHTFEAFRHERLSLLDPRGIDLLQGRQWLLACTDHKAPDIHLHSVITLQLAMVQRNCLSLVPAAKDLAQAALQLNLNCKLLQSDDR